eukprot:GHRR01022588.1.p1 GENE.GHRR01022588.1~~GHRR01022588.1.p1  ORF type:complete len:229 (+),score=112.20 GHRR01022588.1:1269-1955(+)
MTQPSQQGAVCSHSGDLMIAANKGVNSGWLVPLSTGICYIGKQGTFMPKSSISKVVFHRTGASSSTFDITVNRRASAGGGDAAQSFDLGQIDAAELNKLQGYFMAQHIKIGTDDDDTDDDVGGTAAGGSAGATDTAAAATAADDDSDDQDDEDFDPKAAPDHHNEEQPQSKKRKCSHGGGAADSGGASDEDVEDEGMSKEAAEYEGSDDDSSDASLVDENSLDDEDDE